MSLAAGRGPAPTLRDGGRRGLLRHRRGRRPRAARRPRAGRRGAASPTAAGSTALFPTDGPPSRRSSPRSRYQGELVDAARAARRRRRVPGTQPRRRPAALLPERELHDRPRPDPRRTPRPAAASCRDPDRLDRRVVGDADLRASRTARSVPESSKSIQYVIETGGEDVLGARRCDRSSSTAASRQRFAGLRLDHAVQDRRARRRRSRASRTPAPSARRSSGRSTSSRPGARSAGASSTPSSSGSRTTCDVAAKLAEDDRALGRRSPASESSRSRSSALRAGLCGSRFGRGVVAPGGLARRAAARAGRGARRPRPLRARAETRPAAAARDLLVHRPPDRQRHARPRDDRGRIAGVGPVARACGIATDARFERPYGAYVRVGGRRPRPSTTATRWPRSRPLPRDRREPAHHPAGIRAARRSTGAELRAPPAHGRRAPPSVGARRRWASSCTGSRSRTA